MTGLEPMASWSRTKRDTKLRHTPMTAIILYNEKLKKSREKSNYFNFKHYLSKSSYTVSEKKGILNFYRLFSGVVLVEIV